jgi:hypothetical protein
MEITELVGITFIKYSLSEKRKWKTIGSRKTKNSKSTDIAYARGDEC